MCTRVQWVVVEVQRRATVRPKAVVAAVEGAVASGGSMDVGEQEVLSGMCGIMEECVAGSVGGGAGVGGVGV